MDKNFEELIEKYSSVIAANMAAQKASGQTEKKLHDDLSARLKKDLEQENLHLKLQADKNAKEKKWQSNREKLENLNRSAGEKVINTLTSIAKATTSTTQSVYNSNDAFTAVIPTLQTVSSAFKTVSSAAFGAGSAIPFVGGLSEAAGKVMGAAVDVASQVAEMQIQNAQKYVDTYTSLSKVGVTFGGALEDMRESAGKMGMSLSEYNKFVTSSVKHLNAFGGSVENGVNVVSRLSDGIAKGNPKLLAMYGSFSELTTGTADYYAMLASSGTMVNKSNTDLTKGAIEYLYNMKELSDLTGKSADALKSENENRMRSAAYQLAVSKMGHDQQQNLMSAMSQIQAKYGDDMAKYAQEYIATGGNVTSKASLQTQAFMKEHAVTVQQILGTVSKSSAEFKDQSAKIITDRASINRKEIEEREGLLKLQAGGGAGNEVVELINRVSAASLSSINAQKDTAEAQAIHDKERAKSASAATTSFTEAINGLNSFKIQMDEQTEKTLPKVGTMVNSLMKVQETLNEVVGKNLVEIVNNYAVPSIEKFADSLQGIIAGGKHKGWHEGRARGSKVQRAGEWLGGKIFDLTHPTAGGRAAAAGGAGNASDYSGLNIKSSESVAGGAVNPALLDKARKLQAMFPEGRFSALNDRYHQLNKPGSKHAKGEAVDFALPANIKGDTKAGKNITDSIKRLGFSTVIDEYNHPSEGATGGHIHAALAKGGVTKGLSLAGEKGPEAVVPLPDGRSIPVSLDSSAIVEKLDELIMLMRSGNGTSEKLLRTLA
ncbi:MAG TPA: hypothetical protein VFM18_19150 [Methanosarcina sp.]|nr:hypothetical protein [Methanosarcina sp.]